LTAVQIFQVGAVLQRLRRCNSFLIFSAPSRLISGNLQKNVPCPKKQIAILFGGAFLQFWGLGHKKNFVEELGAGRKFEVRIGHFCSKTHN